jgi:hypothetical protein
LIFVISEFSCFNINPGTLCKNETACNFAGFCNGISLKCLLSNPKPNGTICRNPVGSCDIPKYCNGIDITYTNDTFLLSGTGCKPNSDTHDNNERKCDGLGPIYSILNLI